MVRKIAAGLLLLALASPAAAQTYGGGTQTFTNWFAVGTPASISATTSSSQAALPSLGPTARICNTGGADAYLVFGTSSSVVATTNGTLLRAGRCGAYNLKPFGTQYTNVAAITASASTTLRVEAGVGSPLNDIDTTDAATAANQTSVQTPIAPATATATKAVATGCQYNASGITPTDGQQFILQCGPKGGLNVGGSVASGAADTGNPVKTGGVFNSSAPTVATGQRVDAQADAHGSHKVISVDTSGNVIDPTLPVQVYGSDSYANIAAGTASTVVKSGAGTLVRIAVNTKGASSNVITVFDNTTCTGTLIATIDGTSDRDHTFGNAFGTGLCVKSTTGTGADMTVIFR